MTVTKLLERETTDQVIGAFFDVYNTLGFGFLEHVYSMALERELVARGRMVGREVSRASNPRYGFAGALWRHSGRRGV